VNVLLLARDLLMASRIEGAAARARVAVARVSDPAELPSPEEVDLLLVDWTDRGGDWGERLQQWSAGTVGAGAPRIVLFGPHVDLQAHAAARTARLGPMRARSRLLAELPALLDASAEA
jgi:hypothetical protein